MTNSFVAKLIPVTWNTKKTKLEGPEIDKFRTKVKGKTNEQNRKIA